MLAPRILARRVASTRAACSRCSAGRACTGCCGSPCGRPALRDRALGRRSASRSRSCCTGCGSRAVTCCGPWSWCRSCCRPSWSGVAFRQLIAPPGRSGALGLDGTAAAIVAALVFFNISVVVRTVGAFWEAIDPRREEAAAALGRESAGRCSAPSPCRRCCPGIVSAASVVFLFCATAFGVVLTMGGLRYANVETEIYLLTTQELDLTGGGGAVGPAAAGDRRAARPLRPRTPLAGAGRPQHASAQPAAAPSRTCRAGAGPAWSWSS